MSGIFGVISKNDCAQSDRLKAHPHTATEYLRLEMKEKGGDDELGSNGSHGQIEALEPQGRQPEDNSNQPGG